MLQPVDLTQEQARELCDALEHEEDGRITTEDSVNLATVVGFLGTRFLPLPAIPAHGTVAGPERSWKVMLARTTDAFVVLQQRCLEYGEPVVGPQTVSAFVVLNSTLPFAIEDRKEGWPLRVRAALLDVVDWTMDQGRPGACATDEHLSMPAWRSLLDPQARTFSILEPDIARLRAVLAGQETVSGLWGPWAADEAEATADFKQCMSMRGIVENLIAKSARPPAAP